MASQASALKSTSQQQTNINAVDPFAFLAQKTKIPQEFIKAAFERMREDYAQSTLTTICGVRIIRLIDVSEFLTAFGISRTEFDRLFSYSVDDMTCTVQFQGEILAKATGKDFAEARTNVEKALFQKIQQHPVHFEKSLVELPPEDARNPSLVLSRFFIERSVYNKGNELTVLPLPNKKDTGEYVAKLVFRDTPLYKGIGSSQNETLIDASKKAIRAFTSSVQRPKEQYYRSLIGFHITNYFNSSWFVADLVPIIVDYAVEIPNLNGSDGKKDLDDSKR